MKTYANKQELKDEIKKAYLKYIAEFDNIPETMKNLHANDIERSPSENLSYNFGWTSLLIKWEEDEKKGLEVKTPSENFKWNELKALYKHFTDTYSSLSICELKKALDENINQILKMIDSMSDEELFTPHKRKWASNATKSAAWEVYKFIHINTVAPFGTFRTKIRKFKKLLKIN